MSDSRSAAADDERAGVYDLVPYNCTHCGVEFQDYRGVEKYEDPHSDTRPTTRQRGCSKCHRTIVAMTTGLWEVQEALKGLHNDKLRAEVKNRMVRASNYDAAVALDVPSVIAQLNALLGLK